MDVRICANGHQVPQANLKACPACGVSLAHAEVVQVDDLAIAGPAATARPIEAEQAPPMPAALTGLPSGLFFLVIGAVLGLIGWLAAAAADGRGMASGISIGLLWVSGVLTSIGVIAIGVKIGVEDARAR